MRFEVPQFIDVEDKIFGPLTFKQFIYLGGGAGLAYVSYKILPFPFWPILTLGFVGLGLLLAFYKLNNRTFIQIAQSWLAFMIKSKLYIWKRSPPKIEPPKPAAPMPVPKPVSKEVTDKTISDLAQNLDILDSYRN
jgi:hypothetical protein